MAAFQPNTWVWIQDEVVFTISMVYIFRDLLNFIGREIFTGKGFN
jgi:hypothetical protein